MREKKASYSYQASFNHSLALLPDCVLEQGPHRAHREHFGYVAAPFPFRSDVLSYSLLIYTIPSFDTSRPQVITR